MKAVTLNDFDTAPVLREDLPAPTPASNEVLVRVHVSSVNPADNSIAAGMLKQMGVEYEFPVILGRDSPASSSSSAPTSPATTSATLSSASSCTPTRPRTKAVGPS